MRTYKRLLSGILAGTMAMSLTAPAGASDRTDIQAVSADAVHGSIRATLRLDYAQTRDTLRKRNVTLSLKQGDKKLGSVDLGNGTSQGLDDVTYTARNKDGGDLGGGEWPDYLDVTLSDLPQGDYTLEFNGTGYVPFTQKVALHDYAQAVILGTGDKTFGLGDVNDDGSINKTDKDELIAALGSQDTGNLKRYDLNGDQKIDIVDLAYVSRQMYAKGDAELFKTAMLSPKVDTAEIEKQLNVTSGSVDDLFLDNGRAVELRAKDGGALEIPITLVDTPELEAIEIVTPEGAGAMQKGTVLVTDDKGEVTEYPFDNTMPEGVHAITRKEGSNVVTIDLGKRVAVKKVTVSVSKSEGDYVVVDSIRFLQDIVPETPVAPNNVVKSVYATEGDSQVILKWGEVPNVTGYKVTYWPENGGEKSEIRTEIPTATVSGLKNLQTYVFTVTPTSEGWEGTASEPVKATPQPAKAPDAPDMVNVQPRDGALHVSWKKSKTATAYEVYYADAAQGQNYVQAGDTITETQTTIQNLTNGTQYQVYVVAVNAMGKSAPSKIATGTPVAVEYKEPAGLPTDLPRIPREQVASITLKDAGNYSASKGTMPFKTDYLMDGDYKTNWTSQSYGDGNPLRSKKVIYTFNQPVDMSYAVYVPRADGYENNMRLYGITVWCEGDDPNGSGTELVVMNGKDKTPVQGKMGNAQDGYFVVLPFPATKKIVKLAIDIEQRNYDAVGVSEVIFFQYDETKDLNLQIDNLFANDAHTELAGGVEETQITAISNALTGNEGYYFYPDSMKDELELARELLKDKKSHGVVLNGIQARSAAQDREKYQQGGSDLQPLGVAAGAGDKITVYAQGIPEGESVTIWATQTHAEAGAWQESLGTIQNGRNVLTVPKIGSQNTQRGGSLYYTYQGTNGNGITLHTRRATDIPVLELGNWYQLDDKARKEIITAYVEELTTYASTIPAGSQANNVRNVTEISMPTVLLSIPATAVMDQTGKGGTDAQIQTLYDNAEAWEQVMHIANTTQGIDNTYANTDMTSRQNIRYMQMFAGAFMYAAGSHIGVEYGSCGGLVNGKPMGVNGNLFGWGIAHEIGHNMDKLGKAECTNNIYSLMVQTFDGKDNTAKSRLEISKKYTEIFEKAAQGNPGASNDVFVQLGLYWQLHLAYDDGEQDAKKPLDFYNHFFKEWKAGSQFGADDSYEDKVALTASYVADKDLTDFFTRWGMQLSDSTKKKLQTYGKETRAIWYLNDDSRRDRLKNEADGAGTITASAKLQGETEVVLNLDAALNTGKLQGYEIRRNGKPVGFTSENTFTDHIGSANHMNFTYTVQAYDTLGNAIGQEVKAGDIRVAYDKTVDASLYDLVRDGQTVTVTMKDGAVSVSGIKLTGQGALAGTGDYTVNVTADGKTVTAKNGNYTKNDAVDDKASYLTYFNKPGADAGDTRIWTYDVEKLEMTNVPENADLQLISYAGDDVAFMDGASVGVLEKDYRYGTGTDDVIKAGTLVVTGTYRGDPKYNTLRIKGDFATTVMGEDGEQETKRVERYVDGYALFFAEIPKDGEVSDISDGIFLFVPNVQKEAELQGEQSHCTAENLLPTRMMVELYRSDKPDSMDNLRLTASSSWIHSPGGDALPTIVLEGEKQ